MMTANNQSNDKPIPHSFLNSCLIGTITFLLLFGLLEVGFRTEVLSGFLPVRSIGSYHTQFEQKLFKLDDYVQTYGGVDVIIIGNSMINTGIVPGKIANQYNDLTGNKPRIFNFGVEGLTISPISELADFLVKRYHPDTLLLFTEIRDYVANNGVAVEENFYNNAWMRLRLGNWSPEGFLVDRSLALQHLLSLRNWSSADFLENYNLAYNRFNAISQTGYEEEFNKANSSDLFKKPDPQNPEDAELLALYKNFSLSEDRIADLESILSLRQLGTQVIVSEMPIYPIFYDYFGGREVHDTYIQKVESIVTASGGIFLPSINPYLIPLDGRSDDHHLNVNGAPVFSTILGKELAKLCLNNVICLDPATERQSP